MKNKQINKFLFMFVIGMSLLFNVTYANADIIKEGNTILNVNGWGATSSNLVLPNIGLSTSEIISPLINVMNKLSEDSFYMDDSAESIINKLIDYYNDYYSLSYDSYFIRRFATGSGFDLCLFNSSDVELFTFSDNYARFGYSFLEGSNFIVLRNRNNDLTSLGGNRYLDFLNNTCYVYSVNGDFSFRPFRTNVSVKTINSYTYNSSKSQYDFYWDGNYYQKAEEQPKVEVPIFETSLTDNEIASVVNNFTNSMHWKNRDSVYNHFFIQHGETDDKYLLVMVSDYMYELLSGLYIPANISSVDYEVMDYDTYSILFNDGRSGAFFPWQTERFNYKLYTSLDGINFDYLRDMDNKDFKKYRWSMDTPVIYSSFYLPFKTLLGNIDNGAGVIINNYSEEIDLKFSELVNSETGENYVFEGLDVKSNEETNEFIAAISSAIDLLVQSIAGVFNLLIDQIFNFSDFLLESYGENVVTLVFAILIKSVTVLVSSIALIFRAVGFILSLVAIPASSSLLSVDVAINTSGLVFSGLNWGKQFIDGLNFIKNLSWNGLGLWTLFESFVSALEIVLFVKIVKKHYSHTF